MNKPESDARIRQRHDLNRVDDMLEFGCRPLEKIPPSRNVEKQVSNGDRSSGGRRNRLNGFQITSVDDHFRSMVIVLSTRREGNLSNRCDRGQRFPPKSERKNRLEILEGTDFTGCVPLERDHSILLPHPTSIIAHLDQIAARSFDENGNVLSAGIKRVLHQLLDGRRRALDYFPCCDLVRQVIRHHLNDAILFSGNFRQSSTLLLTIEAKESPFSYGDDFGLLAYDKQRS